MAGPNATEIEIISERWHKVKILRVQGDVYVGKKEEILQGRAEKKRLTLERRKWYNLGRKWNDTT